VTRSSHSIDWAGPAREAARHLSCLVRLDTTNPPGNETAAARYVAGVLEAEGIGAQVLEPAPGRGSVIARVAGTGNKPAVLLLSHLDVVPATAAEWSADPFSGETRDGAVWGRGSLDCKGLTALWLTLIIHARRTGARFPRDLILAATADEEAGGSWGVRWLVENHFDLIDAPFCLNEGGGMTIQLNNRTYMTYQNSEKSVCWLKLQARGPAGHASIPIDENAVVLLAEAIAALGRTPLPVHLTETARGYIMGMAAAQPEPIRSGLGALLDERTAAEAVAALPIEPFYRNVLSAMLRNTASPTILRAGDKTNVIPSTASAEVDCRILPGQTPDSLRGEIAAILERALGPKGVARLEIEFPRSSLPTESPAQTEMTADIKAAVARHCPEAHLIPLMATGATDARYLRPKGMTVYGFWPLPPGVDVRGVHGVDERLPIPALEFGLKVLWDVLTAS
jgi:acetylornithine deacetylase/succinyl-diaminopimelate desuccinylase-like protein